MPEYRVTCAVRATIDRVYWVEAPTCEEAKAKLQVALDEGEAYELFSSKDYDVYEEETEIGEVREV